MYKERCTCKYMYNYSPSVHMISIILGMDLVTECNYYNDRPFLYTFSVLNKKISALVVLEMNHI